MDVEEEYVAYLKVIKIIFARRGIAKTDGSRRCSGYCV